jgi:phosphoribosyl-ATP pyrophosphohydrolase
VRVKTFDELYSELERKLANRQDGSRTVAQIQAGVHAIGKKIVEEAAEVWIAAEHESKERTASEISQLIYHLQVMMLAKGIRPDAIWRRL